MVEARELGTTILAASKMDVESWVSTGRKREQYYHHSEHLARRRKSYAAPRKDHRYRARRCVDSTHGLQI